VKPPSAVARRSRPPRRRAGAGAALLALGAALAAVPARAADERRPREDLVTVARALTEIEAAEMGGRIAEERQRRVAEASARPLEVVPRFLALATLPRDQEAWSAFRGLAQQFPGSPWGALGMARVYLAWGTLDQAEAEFDRALALEPDNWIGRLLRGQARERRERWEEARADYAAVLAADPQNPEAHLGLARLRRRQGDVEGAWREASQALAAFPEHYQALSLLATLAAERGDRKTAAGLVQRAAAVGPRDYQARVAMARLQGDLGDTRGAIAQWRAALHIKEDAAGWKGLAAVARQGGDAEAEVQALSRLVLLEGARLDHWRRLAELRLLAGDGPGAEAALRKVLDRDPRDAASHRSLGRLLEKRGEAVGAIRHYREAGQPARAEREALEKAINVEKIPRGEVQALQRTVGRLLDRTYRKRLEQQGALKGVVQLRVSADAAGAATQVEVIGDSVRDGFVLACAYWNLRDASYPKGRAGRYTFKFDLRPSR
jgi:tetratricopeptide (TPR) repeat protein